MTPEDKKKMIEEFNKRFPRLEFLTFTQKKVHNALIEYEKLKGRYPRQVEIAEYLNRTRDNLRQHLYPMIEKGAVERFESEEIVKYVKFTFGENWKTEKTIKEYPKKVYRYKALT